MNFCLFGDCKVIVEYRYDGCILNEDGDFRQDKYREQCTFNVTQFLLMISRHLRNDDLFEFKIKDDSFVFMEFNVNTGETLDYYYKILQIKENL